MTQKLRSAFALLWASETAFDLGAALMTFALGVWIFERTGSPQQFTGAILASAFPTLLMTPVAGALADAFDRRWVIAGCDAASALLIGVLAVLLFQDRLALDQLYVFNAANAVVSSIRIPAYRAAMGSIVPRDRMTQAGGLIGLTRSLLEVGAPMIAGYVMGAAGLAGVIAVQVLLVVAGGYTAFRALSWAHEAIRGTERQKGTGSIFNDVGRRFAAALRYFRQVPAMGVLSVFGAVQESLLVLAASMMIPLILSAHTSGVVGVVLSCGALGSMVGSVVLVAVPMKNHLVRWMLISQVVVSLFVLVTGLATSTTVWAVCAFGAYVGGTASAAFATALLLRKTPVAIRGSIFALNAAINGVSMCLTMLIGGYLAEHVFGLALTFVVCGGVGCVLSLLALLPNRFRNFDVLTLDPDETPAPRVDACSAPPLVV